MKFLAHLACIVVHGLLWVAGIVNANECVFGREERVTACDQLSTQGTWEGPRHGSATCTYNPPAGWALVDHQVVVHSSNNGSTEVSIVSGGSNFTSESDLRDAYDSVKNAAVRAGKADLSAKISEKYSRHLNEIRKFSASHNTLQAIVRASAHGNELFDRKRGWQVISVYARLRCIGVPSGYYIRARLMEEFGLEQRSPDLPPPPPPPR